jgi:hypothetical protein
MTEFVGGVCLLSVLIPPLVYVSVKLGTFAYFKTKHRVLRIIKNQGNE